MHQMACKVTTVPFRGTKEQEEKLLAVIAELRDTPGALMPIMQRAQDIYGIATFYAQFALAPKGKYRIAVCLGTACYVKGAQAVFDKICEVTGLKEGQCTADGKFSLEACRCVGACGLAPVMMINDDVYGRLTPDQIEGILGKY